MNAFRSSLAQYLFRRRAGLLIAGILRAAFCTALLLVVLGVLDYYAGFSEFARQVARACIIGVGVGTALWAIIDAMSFMRRDAAKAADLAGSDQRKRVLSALEFERTAARSPLETWLRARAVESAAEGLGALPFTHSIPVTKLRKHGAMVFLIAAILGALWALAPRAVSTIAARLFDPRADVPPYSSLEFSIGPRPAEVLYGGELLVTAEITGGKIAESPRCLTRDPVSRVIEESPAFQESETRYSRKLEKIAAPLEVAFAVGRARSAWLPVHVKLQPKVQEILVTVDPPAYTRLPRREFPLGSQELTALPGSRVSISVASNRPLSAGSLKLETLGMHKGETEVPGERVETHSVKFTYLSKGGTMGSLRVQDVVGTWSEILKFEQKLLPDERPEVVLSQPSGDILATPDTELSLEARASDDFGLARVALVRKLVGYRERSAGEVFQSGSIRHQVNGKINLSTFGVLPGQTIELAVEAGDTNPNLLGVSVSDPARIRIITREQYAQMLREQTTLEEFAERYAALQEAMEAARKSLDEMEVAAKSGDAKRAEEARQKAFDAHKNAAEVFGQIAKDFQIFDTDASLAQVSGEVAKQLGENGRALESLKGASPGDLADAVKELKERLGKAEEEAAPEMKKGKALVAAGRVIDQAGRFSELLQKQRDLTRDLNRAEEQIRRGESQAAQALKDLGRRQTEIRDELQNMQQELSSALGQLPEGFEKLQEQGQQFLDLLGALEVPPTMTEGAKAAEQANSATAGAKGREALEKMEAMLKKNNSLCKMCRGEDESFPWPQDLSQSMQQLMQSLLSRRGGSGTGQKPGDGGSGSGSASDSSDSGFSMQGKMPRLPVHGPPRARFSKKATPGLAGGKSGQGSSKDGGRGNSEVAGSSIASTAAPKNAGESAAAEAVPESYRAAVKRFFSSGETAPTNSQNKP